ncbi:unnamed protein product [Acanthoscelides obtectus]|uniref:Tc1-like transposase DDE domain-containing protein n=1 Tax=Acanthoscelides obtectus TaxID=200917 RepID=A0A9P0L8I1_ACAOB|nr:unnamed protein product [Acanthoscelides obtectus]CAK1674503.1 hypothetical protein AOBTE_LOCUS29640 [Acanthoscelides obtectus]
MPQNNKLKMNSAHKNNIRKLSFLGFQNRASLKASLPGRSLIIILHIGSDNGFVEDGLLVFESKQAGDYHADMNADLFEEWFENIISRLEENAVIVMDNASFHNRRIDKAPNSGTEKGKYRNGYEGIMFPLTTIWSKQNWSRKKHNFQDRRCKAAILHGGTKRPENWKKQSNMLRRKKKCGQLT